MTIETANRLFQYRKEHHLSQEELAEKIGVSRQAVSKWERAEASPDTENLIALSKIYGVTLDEMLTGEKDGQKGEPKQEEQSQEPNQDPQPEQKEDRVSFKNGIHVDAKNGDQVHIGFDGVHVHEHKGAQVNIDGSGVSVIDKNGNEQIEYDENGHIIFGKDKKKHSFWYKFPFPIIAIIVFIVWGLLYGWSLCWITFLTIPLYYSLVDAIVKKKAKHFAYPVLAAIVYLVLGIQFALWHPAWIIFLTIPLYYGICEWIEELKK